MAMLHMPDLSLIDFVGLEEDNEIDPKDPLSAIALVCKVALSKLEKCKKALKRREESKQAEKEEGKKIQIKRAMKPPSRFRDSSKEVRTADHKVKKVNKSSSEEQRCDGPNRMSAWLRRTKRVRKRFKGAIKDYETGDGAGGCGSLALQVTKMEDRAESSRKRQRSPKDEEEWSYSPEAISVSLNRPKSVRKRSKRAIEDHEDTSNGCGLLALQKHRSETHMRKRSLKGEEEHYSPEPISVWPPRPERMRRHSKHVIDQDYDADDGTGTGTGTSSSTSCGALALQVTQVEDEVESHEKKRKRSGEKKKKPKRKNANENKPKKQRPPKPPSNTGPEPPPGLPESFRGRMEQMGGLNPLLVIQKRLFHTDITKGQNRLSIPISSVRNHKFLTEYETAWLNSRNDEDCPNPIDVKIMDAEKVRDIKLRRWEMPKDETDKVSSSYVLNKPWHKIVLANKWIIGDLVQLWAFRVGENLAFAIVKVDENAEH